MRLLNHKAQYGGQLGSEHQLFFLGDAHVGARLTHKKALLRDLSEIAKQDPETTHLILMGDMLDGIDRSDRRYDEEEIDPEIVNLYSGITPSEQCLDYLTEILSPVKPFIRCVLRGNHAQKNYASGLWERAERKLTERHYLNIPHLYGGYSCFWRLQLRHISGGRNRSVVAHLHHGWQAGRTRGAKVNQLEKEAAYFPTADLLIRGHSHDLFWDRFDSLVPSQRFNELVARHIGVGHSGTYLRTASTDTEGYAERGGYRAAAVGCLKVKVRVNDEGYELEGTI